MSDETTTPVEAAVETDEFATLTVSFAKTGEVDKPLWFEVWLDGTRHFGKELTDHLPVELSIQVPDTEASHELKFVLAGKTYGHTLIDANGDILADCAVKVTSIVLEDLDVIFPLTQASVYRHAFNKPDPRPNDFVEEQFIDYIGCNGEAKTTFTTPAFVWLLENL